MFVVCNLIFFGLTLFGPFEWLTDWSFSRSGQIVKISLFAMSFVGSVFFAIDACRRQYEQEQLLGIVLGVVGPFSFGLTTVLYYLRFGSRPAELEYGHTFCETCINTSRESPHQLDLATINFIHGGRLVGRSDRCNACGSTVRTHCVYIAGVPIFSHGSFRVLCPASGFYVVRKCDCYWPHLLLILIMPLIVVSVLLVLLIAR